MRSRLPRRSCCTRDSPRTAGSRGTRPAPRRPRRARRPTSGTGCRQRGQRRSLRGSATCSGSTRTSARSRTASTAALPTCAGARGAASESTARERGEGERARAHQYEPAAESSTALLKSAHDVATAHHRPTSTVPIAINHSPTAPRVMARPDRPWNQFEAPVQSTTRRSWLAPERHNPSAGCGADYRGRPLIYNIN